jgi:hypothetical protein
LYGEAYLELAHDALIFGWGRLLAWVREDAPFISHLRRLTADVATWDETQTKPRLLWADRDRLPIAKALVSAIFPGLNLVESRFVVASLARASRNLRVRRGFIGLLIILTLGALLPAYVAIGQLLLANTRRLSSEAQVAAAQNPDGLEKAMLLAGSASLSSDALGVTAFDAAQLLRNSLELLPKNIATLTASSFVDHIYFTPNSERMIAVGGAVTLYSLPEFEKKSSIDVLISASWSAPSGNGQFIGCGGNQPRLWDVFSAKQVRTFRSDGWASGISLNYDGSLMSAVVGDNKLDVWAAGSDQSVFSHDFGSWNIEETMFSPTGLTLAIRGSRESLWFIKTHDWTEIGVVAEGNGPIRVLSYSKNGRYLLSAGDEALARVYRIDSSISSIEKIAEFGIEGGDAIWSASISSDGRYVATAHKDGSYRVWDVAERRPAARINNGLPGGA